MSFNLIAEELMYKLRKIGMNVSMVKDDVTGEFVPKKLSNQHGWYLLYIAKKTKHALQAEPPVWNRLDSHFWQFCLC